MMKKLVGLAALVFLFTCCDDGDLVFEDINFEDVDAQRCGNLIYKINDAEALVLKIGADQQSNDFINAFPLEPTIEGQPTTYTIDNDNIRVVYQLYSGNVDDSNLCAAVRPATPVIVEDWEATSGRIEIVTTMVTTANNDSEFEGGEEITGYQHNIILRDVNFSKADGTIQFYSIFPFGIYQRTVTPPNFNFGSIALMNCPGTDRLYKFTGFEGITLDINPILLDTTQLNTPKTDAISATSNMLTYSVFPSGTLLDQTFFCGTPPTAPVQIWTGVAGISGVSGIVEVITTQVSNGFLHTIRLKQTSLESGRNKFLLADDYLLGEIITP